MPKLDFQTIPINKNSGWCDDIRSTYYNKFIKFPFSYNAEFLYREDDIYNIICVINYNTKDELESIISKLKN